MANETTDPRPTDELALGAICPVEPTGFKEISRGLERSDTPGLLPPY